MAMLKKDYELIARTIRHQFEYGSGPEEVDTLRSTARNLALEFQRENPRFDLRRFLDACGFPEDTDHDAAIRLDRERQAKRWAEALRKD